ncbi:MAG: hypothetical protein AAB340_00995, partial [Patescibacteria group bacterium]
HRQRENPKKLAIFELPFGASQFWKDSAFSELTDALRHRFAPQALNLPQNSLAQLMIVRILHSLES